VSPPGEAVGTFLGIPPFELSHVEKDTNIVIIGASERTSHQAGQPSHAAAAPDAIRGS
jgi:hypothetical protein